MSTRAVAFGILIAALTFGAVYLWRRSPSTAAAKSPRELCETDVRDRARCDCVVGQLETTADGREVLGLVVEYQRFLSVIESAASHAVAFDAMNTCNKTGP